MKKAKRLTKREKKAMKAVVEASTTSQPATKPRKQKEMFKLSFYLNRSMCKRFEKAHQEKRDKKAGVAHAH